MKSTSSIPRLFAAAVMAAMGGSGIYDNRGRTERKRVTNIHPMITSPAHEIRDHNAKIDLANKAKHYARIERKRMARLTA